MHNSTAILVLGMPRSGTSAVTRVFNMHGAVLSDNLLPPADANPKGFFESTDALAIHERLLNAMGRSWFDISEMPIDWIDSPEAKQAQLELAELVKRDYLNEKIWIVKEPRMCRFVSLWLRVLEDLNISPKVLLVARQPDEVVQSITAMVGDGQWSVEHTKILWLEYFFEAEKATRNIPRAIITYDQLLTDWEFHVDRIGNELEIQWPRLSTSVKSSVDAYLSSESRHHKCSLPYQDDPHTFSMAEKTYEVCQQLEGEYWKSLESICVDFFAMLAFFQRPMRDLVKKVAEHYSNIALAQRIEFDQSKDEADRFLATQQSELDELKQRYDSLRARQPQLEELTQQQEKLLLSHQLTMDELKRYYEALQQTQKEDRDKLLIEVECKETVALALEKRIVELEEILNGISYELKASKVKEEAAYRALQEVQTGYTELKDLSASKKWLAKSFVRKLLRFD